MTGKLNKTKLAKRLGIARATLYYRSRKKQTDEANKQLIEAVMESNPSYGHKRIAPALKMNKKKVKKLSERQSAPGTASI